MTPAEVQTSARMGIFPIVEINAAWCKGCYLCVSFCPRDVLDIDPERWTGGFHPVYIKHIERCTVCRNCELFCPDLAIEVKED